MLSRYTVVAFQTIRSTGGKVEECGGGVCFIPIDERAGWQSAVDRLVRERFHHPLGRSVEIGIASLDDDLIATICERHDTIYWQGGDD